RWPRDWSSDVCSSDLLLAQEGVAAVAGAVGPDLAGLGEVDDVLVLGVAGPGHVGLTGLERRAHGVQAGDEPALVAEDLQRPPSQDRKSVVRERGECSG